MNEEGKHCPSWDWCVALVVVVVTGCEAQGRGENQGVYLRRIREKSPRPRIIISQIYQLKTVDSGIKIKFLVSFNWSEQRQTTRFCTPLRAVKMANEKTLGVPYNPTFCSLSAIFGVKWPCLMKVTVTCAAWHHCLESLPGVPGEIVSCLWGHSKFI